MESIITVTKLYTISLYCITFQCGHLLDPMVKKATQVLVFDVGGVTVATKFRYRCRDCPVAGGEVQYHADQYGSPSAGYKFYSECGGFIRGSRSTWFSRSQMQYFFSSFHHAWVR